MFLKYAKFSCSIRAKLAQRDSLNHTLSAINTNFSIARNEINQKADNYEQEVSELDNIIYLIKSEYEQKYREVSQKHEARHGHMITTEYERSINKLEKWKASRINQLEEKIKILDRDKDEDSDLKKLKKKIDSLQALSKNNSELLLQYEKEIMALKNQIQNIEAEMDQQLQQISAENKNNFFERRQKIKLNPCSLTH